VTLFASTSRAMLRADLSSADHPRWVGLNPEVAPRRWPALDFAHGVAQALEAGKPSTSTSMRRKPAASTRNLRFASEDQKGAFFLVKLAEDNAWEGMRHFGQPPLPHRGRGWRVGIRVLQHAHVLIPRTGRRASAETARSRRC